MKWIVLSPHLDDAVLSLGGLLGREVAAGRRVSVWSCFTAGPPLDEIPPSQRVFGDYQTRRAEDLRALAVLGAEPRWLGFHERIWRRPPLANTLHVFRTPPREDDFEVLPAIRAIVADALDTGARVYAPLGVGHHTDHLEVTVAVLRELLARRAYDQVRFYEDPYALGGACRRAHLITRTHRWRRFGAPAWASPRVGALLQLVASAARGPGLEDYVAEVATLRWRCEPVALAPADEERKLAACVEYGSQMTAFGGAERVKRFLRRGHRSLGGEPIWSATPVR